MHKSFVVFINGFKTLQTPPFQNDLIEIAKLTKTLKFVDHIFKHSSALPRSPFRITSHLFILPAGTFAKLNSFIATRADHQQKNFCDKRSRPKVDDLDLVPS